MLNNDYISNLLEIKDLFITKLESTPDEHHIDKVNFLSKF